jgi:hypothetical protein
MGINARFFIKRLLKRNEEVQQGVRDITKNMVAAMMDELVPATPIRTGRARRNWQVTMGEHDVVEWAPRTPPERNAEVALENARRRIDAYHDLSKPLGVRNPIPYLTRLNEGYSAQAPAGFIQDAILRARSVVNKGFRFRP